MAVATVLRQAARSVKPPRRDARYNPSGDRFPLPDVAKQDRRGGPRPAEDGQAPMPLATHSVTAGTPTTTTRVATVRRTGPKDVTPPCHRKNRTGQPAPGGRRAARAPADPRGHRAPGRPAAPGRPTHRTQRYCGFRPPPDRNSVALGEKGAGRGRGQTVGEKGDSPEPGQAVSAEAGGRQLTRNPERRSQPRPQLIQLPPLARPTHRTQRCCDLRPAPDRNTVALGEERGDAGPGAEGQRRSGVDNRRRGRGRQPARGPRTTQPARRPGPESRDRRTRATVVPAVSAPRATSALGEPVDPPAGAAPPLDDIGDAPR